MFQSKVRLPGAVEQPGGRGLLGELGCDRGDPGQQCFHGKYPGHQDGAVIYDREDRLRESVSGEGVSQPRKSGFEHGCGCLQVISERVVKSDVSVIETLLYTRLCHQIMLVAMPLICWLLA